MNVEPSLFVCPVCGQLQAPDVVDESKPVPPAKPRLCGKCMHRAGLSRRRFLFLGAAAGITLAVAPAIALALPPTSPPDPFDFCSRYYGRRGGKTSFYLASAEQKRLYQQLLQSDNRFVYYLGGCNGRQ